MPAGSILLPTRLDGGSVPEQAHRLWSPDHEPVLEVEDAEPGDVLEVEFLELRSVDWGWMAVLPGLGLLAEDFPDAHLHLWDLTTGDTANFLDVADIPIRPFCGVVGVCPDVPGARLSLGDPHAAQGDGELCVSAIEASLSDAARIRLLMRAAQGATRAMIDHLGTRYGLAPIDVIRPVQRGRRPENTEVVDAPNRIVSAYLPKATLRTL
jgi:acetamidase/formamidase